jgi:hypothetical protein
MASLLNALARPSVTNEPPTQAELRRNDIVMVALLIFALFLGFGIRGRQVTAARTVDLSPTLTIDLPANWISGQSDTLLYYARNPRSPSIFSSEVSVFSRTLQPDENLVTARTNFSLRRTQELPRYRELVAEDVTVLGGEPAFRITYAYVADPSRESGAIAPPVVVQAQDLFFVRDNALYVVTVASDINIWDEANKDFSVVFDSLRLQLPGGAE